MKTGFPNKQMRNHPIRSEGEEDVTRSSLQNSIHERPNSVSALTPAPMKDIFENLENLSSRLQYQLSAGNSLGGMLTMTLQ